MAHILNRTLRALAVALAAAAIAGCNAGNIITPSTAAPGSDTQGTVAGTSDSGMAALTGSVGDGPITGAHITVSDAGGRTLATTTSDAAATYAVQIPANSAYPIIITATGGTDMVTGGAPAYPLATVAVGPHIRVANISPLSTLIVRTAQQLAGGLSAAGISDAATSALRVFNAGLDATVADPITAAIDDSNAAMTIKTSEVLAEIIRRSASVLQARNAAVTQSMVVQSLSADLTDGALDGAGAVGSDETVAITASIIAGQVLIEALSNNLTVNGSPAAALLDSALHSTHPAAAPSVAQLAVTSPMLAQIDVSLQTAQRVAGDTRLGNLQDQINKLQPGMSPEQAAALVPASHSADLQNATASVAGLSSQRLDEIGNWLRSAYGAAPPIVSVSVSPAVVSPGASVMLSWQRTANATCTTDGPAPWSAPTDSGDTVVGPLTVGGTFTLTCSNDSGTYTTASAAVTVGPDAGGGTANPTTTTPPTVALSVTPSKVNPGGTVTLDWAYTAGATCQTAGPYQWQASADTGQTTINGISKAGTFTLTCSNAGGTASSSYSVSLNAAPVMTAAPTASPGWISGEQTAQLHVTASDPDHDLLTYAWRASSGTISGSGPDVLFTPPPGGTDTTVHFTVAVTDSGGLTTTGAGDVVVRAPAAVMSPTQLPLSSDSASSFDAANNLVPANAVDGSTQTSWTVVTMPQWIILDLGSQQLLSGVNMLIDGTNGATGLSYTVETSADKQTWASAFVGTSVTPAPQWTQANFSPVYARYLRINLSARVLSDSANVYDIVAIGRNISTAPVNAGVTAAWQPNSDAVDGYILYFGASASTVAKQVTKVANTTSGFDPNSPSLHFDSWYDFGLLPGDSVCFKLQAYNITGPSALSSAVCQTI